MEYALTLKDFGQGKSPIALPVSRCTPQNMTVPRCLSGQYSDPTQHGVVKQHSIAQQHIVVNLNSTTSMRQLLRLRGTVSVRAGMMRSPRRARSTT